jgi:hypothetical protein
LFLLVASITDVPRVKPDNLTVVFLLILILLPFVRGIRKIKWGELEAEISEQEVKVVVDELKDVQPSQKSLNTNEKYSKEQVKAVGATLARIYKDDHILALAKLRLELENVVRIVYKTLMDDKESHSVGEMIRTLNEARQIDPKLADVASDVINLCNRAVHGENIDRLLAYQVIESGMKVLAYFFGYSSALIEFGTIVSNDT